MSCISVYSENGKSCISVNAPSEKCIEVYARSFTIPMPEITFKDSGGGEPLFTDEGYFKAYMYATCKIRVSNHEEAINMGLHVSYLVSSEGFEREPNGTITWVEPPTHGIIYRTMSFRFTDEFGHYKERIVRVVPELPQIIYENVDGTNGIKTALSSFYSLFESDSNVYKITIYDTENVSDWHNICYNSTSLVEFNIECDTSNVTNLWSAWLGCSSLTSFPDIDTSAVTDFFRAWNSCTSLTSFPSIDTSQATDLSYTWAYCTSLTSFPYIDTHNVSDFGNAWQGCSSLTSFPDIDTSNATTLRRSWAGCSALTSFPYIDTGKVTILNQTWRNCSSLSGAFPAIDTGNVTNFSYTWHNCSSLTSFPTIDTHKATSLERTWAYCSSISGAFPAIDTSNVTSFYGTWEGCSALTSFPYINTSKATNMYKAWTNCSSLSGAFPFIDTSNVTSMYATWYGCSSITSFPHIDTSSATDKHNHSDFCENVTWEGCNSMQHESCSESNTGDGQGNKFLTFVFDDGVKVPTCDGIYVYCGNS